MNTDDTSRFVDQISRELKVNAWQVKATGALLAEGASIPFIARYRKEKTGSLDEVQIAAVRDRMDKLVELESRRQSILGSLQERELLTEDLKGAILAADNLSRLEDLYLPYRPKKRTRATIAREAGLEPLADLLFRQDHTEPEAAAKAFVNEEKGVADIAKALAGARDILAERFSDDAEARGQLRLLFQKEGRISAKLVKGKEIDGAKFKDYFDWSESAAAAPSHRILAMFRGEHEGFLAVSIEPSPERAVELLERIFLKGRGAAANQVRQAIEDSYKRLLRNSLETETRQAIKARADEQAILVFVDNLRELLLSSPLGRKQVLALDPGFRTGCKLVCLDRQGKLLDHEVIYPHTGGRGADEAGNIVLAFCRKFRIEAIAIGNGTASRETEIFVRNLGLPASIPIIMVNESGASIYSASEAAREEFPNQDVTVRGAVSIGRRLMDPLAELVKIDPKSIGVGQYQHDVDQKQLRKSLDDTVISCVNGVGVEVNTASKQLLAYVSGLNDTVAANIVAQRDQQGPFQSRTQLKKVPRLGPKAFEQAAGFLRIRDGKNPLDASAVHPESYPIVEQMAKDLHCQVADLMSNAELRQKINLQQYVTDEVGMPTLKDILAELAKPGRDPRQQFEIFQFAEGVHELADLKPGMRLPGIVTNVTAFGAFVDVGVHQDGLVHISQLSDHFVRDPAEIVKVQQRVEVTVVEVDLDRKRIALSMKTNPERRRDGGSSGPRGGQRPPPQRQDGGFGGDWFAAGLEKGRRK